MFKSIISLALFTGAALAQGILFGSPAEGASVAAGSDLIVQLEKPNSLSSSVEVAVVIGIESCSNQPCPAPTDMMGQLLYNGPYNPVAHEPQLPHYQNISVTIPASLAKGTAQLNILHVNLIGAGPIPNLQILNRTITIT
ncbi:hypothetical protein SERLA73DRAFT_142740 [Serpula lacrymans var. lacrymans S7.3]|uniref:Phosphatidylglycerol/phosphatidylinositol transfer protein n=2 Tax=Serpula lacrymans var. lacrymans TaxID=341189 RepID=F8Q8A9_SERL3|nr:uncharacterized protein SERLADRAFT_398952 [Serpula lacrymans var. lacrymans S7.9]EGN95797.1 hypothetical protein SERLA73DRAFT_142740 [Serpula lacrymans var. lacrymans S7.3]EGO21317.1 hypothetical protein SERLADRAFT_398952 [Serpula lacrymans var. lacrymans S7.9]